MLTYESIAISVREKSRKILIEQTRNVVEKVYVQTDDARGRLMTSWWRNRSSRELLKLAPIGLKLSRRFPVTAAEVAGGRNADDRLRVDGSNPILSIPK